MKWESEIVIFLLIGEDKKKWIIYKNLKRLTGLIRSTAPNPDFQIGVKSAAQYQP
jgi:hypothetical protein